MLSARKHTRKQTRRLASLLAFSVTFFGVLPILHGAEKAPVLVVPASQFTLQVAVGLPEGVKLKAADAWQLVEIGGAEAKTPATLAPAIADDGSAGDKQGRLLASIAPRQGADSPRRFRLEPAKGAPKDGFRFEEVNQRSLKLLDGGEPVMVYNHGVITNEKVPKRDSRRSRACYIHPVWGINAEVLTDDFPRDHYHHHGIFWAWPHVGIGGKHYDLWMYGNIRPKFVRWICRRAGPAAAVLAVENGWFVGEKFDKKVMIERVWMRTYKTSDDTRAVDLEFVWIPVGRPITLRGAGGKSYGGLTVRMAVKDPSKSIITTPRGSSKADLKQTPLPWADLTAKFGGGDRPSGAAVFVHPAHPDYPPTWLTRHYGPLCVGWPGVKGKTFEPGVPIRLDYRIFIHKTQLGVDALKQAYQGYTTATKVTWEQ